MNTPLHDPARDLRQLRTWDIPWSEISHLYGQSEREVRRWHNEGVPARATVLPRPAILDWETVFVVSDMQFPTTDRALVETSQQIMADVKPDRMLFNGDTLDFPQLSSYKHVKVKLKSARGDIEDLHTDIMPGYLDTLPYGRVNRPSLVTSGAAGDATHIWMDGNHEQRYERYVDHNAGDLGMVLSPRDFLALDPSMVYYQYEPRTGADLSGLMVSHGWRATKYTAANTMADVDSSVLVGHCFDEATEILTPEGWTRYTDLEKGGSVLTLDADGPNRPGNLKWDTIQQVHVYDDFDELVTVKAHGLDLAVTGGHALMQRKRGGTKDVGWVRRTADEQFGKETAIPLAGLHDEEALPLSESQIRVLAWVLAEGHIAKGKYVRVAQSDYDGHLESLERDLVGAGIGFTKTQRYHAGETEHGQHRNHDAYRYYLATADIDWMWKWITPDKGINRSLAGMSVSQMLAFLDTYTLADGCVNSGAVNSRQLAADDPRHIDFLQELAVRTGHRSTVNPRDGVATITINSRPEVRAQPGSWSRRPYSGKVWCVSVGNGTLVVRRNGRTAITGNTHRVGMFAKTVKDGIHYSYEMGHMCDESTVPKAVPGRQNWQQVAGAIVTLHRTIPGLHTVDLLPVLGGETVVWGSREYKIDR